MSSKKERIDRLLVERGLFESRAKAQAAIEAGLVRAGERQVRKASEAIAVARLNAAKAGVAERIQFLVGSLFADLSGVFDVIVSNPPYISDEEFLSLPDDVRKFEPSEALLGGSEGISLHREIIGGGSQYLEAGGYLIMEIGAGQRRRLEDLLRETGSYANILCRQDYAGCDRVILARRI